MSIKLLTAGESHGRGIMAFLEGIPAGLSIIADDIDAELARRQKGYGRGARMKIEMDFVRLISGIRHARSLGSPIVMYIHNNDWNNCKPLMSPVSVDLDSQILTNPRPGHADLAGLMKYGVRDFRDILERASARETAGRVAAGAICKELLKIFNIKVFSYVSQIGNIRADIKNIPDDKLLYKTEKSSIRCPDEKAERAMIELIKKAMQKGDTLGGKFVVKAINVMPGLGSHTQWNLKLDAKLSCSLMSIQGIKAVEFGYGSKIAETFGSLAHDEIFYKKGMGFYRKTNMAGGIEGGMSNGEPIEISCSMKPIPSLAKPLRSVNIISKKAEKAESVRSDVCAVPAAAIVGEAAVAFEIAAALKEKFGGDSIEDMKKAVKSYEIRLKAL